MYDVGALQAVCVEFIQRWGFTVLVAAIALMLLESATASYRHKFWRGMSSSGVPSGRVVSERERLARVSQERRLKEAAEKAKKTRVGSALKRATTSSGSKHRSPASRREYNPLMGSSSMRGGFRPSRRVVRGGG